MQLNFSWKSFLINQLPMLLVAFLIVGMFLIFPPPSSELWGHENTEFRRIILPYVGLFFTFFYSLYFLYQILRPGSMKIDFKNKKVFYGKNIIDIKKVKIVTIYKKKAQNGILISLENKDVILMIPSWYKAISVQTTILKLKSYCLNNNIEFKIIRE